MASFEENTLRCVFKELHKSKMNVSSICLAVKLKNSFVDYKILPVPFPKSEFAANE